MSTITDIKAGIEARIEIAVSTYAKLSYQTDISNNKFKGNSKGYAVLPSSALEVDGLLGSYNMDHEFSISLTNSYNQGAKSQIGDELKTSRIAELQDDILAIYSDLSVNKGAIDASILVINSLNISEPDFIDEEKVIIINFTVNVKYKTNT